MISVDISNIWGSISLPDLLAEEKNVFDAERFRRENFCVFDKGKHTILPFAVLYHEDIIT